MKQTRQIQVTPIFDRTAECQAKTIVNVGGARSSKSWSIAQLLVTKLLSEKRKTIGVCRKTFPALRMTAYKLVIDLLKDYGVFNPARLNKTEHTYIYGDNIIYFFSLDDPEKIKSTEFNYIWIEEANEFTYEDYVILKLRLSAPTIKTQPNHIYLSLNPIDGSNWIAKKLVEEADVAVIHSTYLDNPFLDADYIKILKQLIYEDENYYKIYTLGEWGLLEERIYSNYRIVDAFPSERQAMAYGLDFGFVNPSVIVKIAICNREVFIEERLYQAGLTNSDLIEFLSHEERADIYADPTELQMIEEISRAGHNVYPANKDVKLGIDLCKRQALNITKESINGITEIRGYRYKKDKGGNVLEEPVKYNDHFMDAMRYGIYGLVDRFGFATANPLATKPTVRHEYKF